MLSAKILMSVCLFCVRCVWQTHLRVIFLPLFRSLFISHALVLSQSHPHRLWLLLGSVSDLCLLVLRSVCCWARWGGLAAEVTAHRACVHKCIHLTWAGRAQHPGRSGKGCDARDKLIYSARFAQRTDYFLTILCRKGYLKKFALGGVCSVLCDHKSASCNINTVIYSDLCAKVQRVTFWARHRNVPSEAAVRREAH